LDYEKYLIPVSPTSGKYISENQFWPDDKIYQIAVVTNDFEAPGYN
tara:strand:- start:127 stop:264 length:138 start_codon:yes stop_codon:yes gene_type:complete